ncbi:MAG: flagellar assembly protein FliH [Aliidongia sp.]|jgi:flagellar assembly protein FliH|nr:flagellar assembly protein FliH [Aliidongia sp.]
MPVVRRFEFDMSFDAPQRVRVQPVEPEPPPPEPEPEPEPPPPPEPTFSQDELDAAYERGLAEGRQAGEFEAMVRIERRLADTIERLCHVLQDSGAGQARAVAAIERQAAEMSMLALRKIFPALLDRAETGELEAMFAGAFEQAIEEPRILVRAAPELIDALKPRLHELAGRAGFEGKLSLVADPRLGDTECRAEWSEGGVERDPKRALDAVTGAIEHGIAAFDRRNGLDQDGVATSLEEMINE